MTEKLQSRLGRITLHLAAYGFAAAAIAVIQQMQLMEFGSYQAVVSIALGAALDAVRKYQTSI